MSTEMMGMASSESDHDVQLMLPGEAESLRPRLVEALERLGYKVLDEQRLTARRGARSVCSFDALDYPTKLTVSLKQLNDFAVLATFSFEIKHNSIMTGGDRRTLEREAEAIAALAAQREAVAACPACGTQVTDDSRFCRRCGALLTVDVAELEVFRLTRGTRAALQHLAMSGILLVVAMLISFFFFWATGPKAIRALTVFVSLFGALGFLTLIQAMWRLHSTLNPRQAKVEQPAPPRRTIAAAPQTAALPPHLAHASVVEGTTELLTLPLAERSAVPVEQRSRDTGPIN